MDAEELDASITRTLQSIDSNFARANTVLNGLIRKARFVVRHSKQAHAKLVPWKDFLLGFAPAEVRGLPLRASNGRALLFTSPICTHRNPLQMKAEFLAMEEADAAPASPAPAQAATAAAPSSRAEFDSSHLGLLSPSAATPFRQVRHAERMHSHNAKLNMHPSTAFAQAEGDSFYMDGGAASDEEDDVQLFGVDESPAAGVGGQRLSPLQHTRTWLPSLAFHRRHLRCRSCQAAPPCCCASPVAARPARGPMGPCLRPS